MSYQTEAVSSQPQMTVTSYTVSHWSSDVCDCCDDCGICLCGAFIPCILGCKVAQDNGDSCCLPFLPGAMIALRTSIRDRYRINGSVCDDWVFMTCCPSCGLCQMAREQKARG
ncbi:cornifelin homolog [Carassius gibelio]|uniref:cornifelin homolog n=1 Tax=Carassius gibelio TaxID=101364 RepID=UPI0022784077|nr:cornifelin homolog [Carassius gibelio]